MPDADFEHWSVHSLEGSDLSDSEAELGPAGGLLGFLSETRRESRARRRTRPSPAAAT